MKSTPEWVQESEAVKQLGIGKSTLRTMRYERRLEPGIHWVYATGRECGPVTYNILAIREMQTRITFELLKEKQTRREAELLRRKALVESYDEASLEKVIAEVQS